MFKFDTEDLAVPLIFFMIFGSFVLDSCFEEKTKQECLKAGNSVEACKKL